MATSIGSGALAVGTTTVYTGKGVLNGLIAISDGANTATVTVYDNTAASGTILAVLTATAAQGTTQLQWVTAVRCDIGITVVVAGTGARAIVYQGG